MLRRLHRPPPGSSGGLRQRRSPASPYRFSWLEFHEFLALSISHKQAHVYALREKAEFSRDETAAILNISPSTVDTHLQRAKEKLTAAENLVQFVYVDADELAEVHPDFFDEAGISDEASSSSDITPLS